MQTTKKQISEKKQLPITYWNICIYKPHKNIFGISLVIILWKARLL